jgi:2-dehydropantoate 2-reductase
VSSAAVLGPGGVGGFLTAALAQAGADVTLVAREETADAIAAGGLHVESVLLGTIDVEPATVTRLERPVDVLFVATKHNGLADALERVAAEPGIVVPLLNGLDHMAVLRERFGARAVAGTIRIEADRPETGRIVHTSRFLRIDLASDDPSLAPQLEAVSDLLADAQVPARIGSSEAQIMWEKLTRLNALACTTSAFDLPLGPIRSTPELRAELLGCIEEAVAVATAEGAELTVADVVAELEDAHAELGSSMRRDIAAGREPELDAIPGAVMRAGARHGIECPTVARLAGTIAARAGVQPPAVG